MATRYKDLKIWVGVQLYKLNVRCEKILNKLGIPREEQRHFNKVVRDKRIYNYRELI